MQDKGKFYYKYPLETSFILDDKRPFLKKAALGMGINQYKKLVLEDGSVIYIHRQAEKVFFGEWCESEDMYRFYLDNGYM